MGIITNKVAIVTGGGSGIGKEISLYLARSMATVIIVEKNIDSGEKLKKKLKKWEETAYL